MVRYPVEETDQRHEHILNAAAKLFRERGIADVSISELMKAAGLTHGSFYNHFRSKQSLVEDCIHLVRETALKQIMTEDPTEEGRRRFAANYLSLTAKNNPGRACLMSSLGPEASRNGQAKAAISQYIHDFIATLNGHFPWADPLSTGAGARRMTASLVGALVLARAIDDDHLSAQILNDVAGQYSPPADP